MAELVYPPVINLARVVFALQGLRFDLRGTEHVPRTGADPVAVTADLRVLMERMLHEAQETYPDRPAAGQEDWWLPARLGGSAPTPDEAAQLDRDERRARIAQAKEARDRAGDRRRGGTP